MQWEQLTTATRFCLKDMCQGREGHANPSKDPMEQ